MDGRCVLTDQALGACVWELHQAQAAALEVREAMLCCVARLRDAGLSEAEICVTVQRAHTEIACEQGLLLPEQDLPPVLRRVLCWLVGELLRESRYRELCRKEESGAALSDGEEMELIGLYFAVAYRRERRFGAR
jgi:hypothetical protein